MERAETVRLHRATFEYLQRQVGGPLPQADLAERWRVSRASVSRWLHGLARMPRAAAQDLADLVAVPIDDLLEPPVASEPAASSPKLESLTPIMQEFVRAEVERALGHTGAS